tara:strand:- start:1215 stop:1466 length:252 start_codon:yes stop_codon:yes gene_type:complete
MSDLMIDTVGWLGFSLIFLGYYFNAKKKIYCFYIWGLGNTVYIIYGYIIDAIPIIAMSIFVLIMNFYGYISWSKENNLDFIDE